MRAKILFSYVALDFCLMAGAATWAQEPPAGDAAPAAGQESVAVSQHGREFIAVLEKENICAVQFHPEKSGAAGAQVLRNFLRAAA